MDKILKKICSLLDSEDVELQCAAARVLGELRPKSADVRLKLGAHLNSPNLTVKNYVLSALEQNPGKETLPYLFPLLREGGKIRDKASTIIATAGPSAVAEAKKLFAQADLDLKGLLVRILGMIGTLEACAFLIDSLPGAGRELRKDICLALRGAIGKMSRDKKRSFSKKINSFLASDRARENADEAASGVILLGYIADSATIGKLLRYTSTDQAMPIRKQALIALSQMDIPAKSNAEIARKIIPLLDEDDYPNIVRNALDLLKRIEIPKGMIKSMKEGLKNKIPAVRSFIISHMGKLVVSPENIGMLIGHLNSGGFQERRAAQDALVKIPEAYPRIIKEMDETKDYEVTMRYISILKAHKDRLSPRDKSHLLARMDKLRASGDDRYSIYATALKAVDQEFLVEKLLSRAKRLKGARKFTEAEKIIRTLVRHSSATAATKYELIAVCLRNSSKDLSPLRRKDDEGLKLIAELLKQGKFPLLKRLKTDKALRPEELYYVGFHFSEKLFDQRKFGIALLKHLVNKSSQSKVGRAAKEKLKLAGIKA